MEEYKKDDRGRSKAKRLTMNDPHTKVDSSTWTPDAAENAGVKTGARPLVKRLYKKGGKVVGKHEGKDSVKHAGRVPRKAGGRTDKLTPDSLINRDVRTANEVREGTKHEGAFKKGGKVHKLGGGMVGDNPLSIQDRSMAKASGMMKKGGKVHKKWGGKSTGVESDYRSTTRDPNYTGTPVSDSDAQSVSNLAKYGSMKGNPTASPDYPERKSGGKIKHPDEKADRQLIKKMIKPTAFKAKGGKAMHHEDCTCKMCGGGRAMKYSGGGIFSGDSKTKVPGAVGGRKAKAGGGGFHNTMYDDTPAPQIADYNFLTGWSNLDKATPDQIAAMKPADRAAAMAAQGNAPTRMGGMPGAGYGAGARKAAAPAPSRMATGPSDLSMMDPQQRADLASQPSGMSAAQQRGMMGRQPQMTTQHGLFGPRFGGQGESAINFSRDVPDVNAKPRYNQSHDWTDELGTSNPGGNDPWNGDMSRLADARGGRTERNKGGRTKGNTTIIIDMGGRKQMQPQPMGMGQMPNAPVNPQRLPPAPQPGMPPQGGMPPMPPMPPQGMPMQRKSGGRTGYPIDTGAGGANARLEKIDAYGLKPSKRK